MTYALLHISQKSDLFARGWYVASLSKGGTYRMETGAIEKWHDAFSLMESMIRGA